VLGSPDRIASNLVAGVAMLPLTLLLAAASIVAAAPYGAAAPGAAYWKIPTLLTWSLLICFPCLHVVLEFLGFRIPFVRNLALALTFSATAGLFALGFAPIVWFIAVTTTSEPDAAVTPEGLSRTLLGLATVLGLVQMLRTLRRTCDARTQGGSVTIIVLWIPLLVFIVWRMAGVLGLRG
jgi:hypothetical protein